MASSSALVLACLAMPVGLAAQEEGGFAVLHGRDTIAVEQFTRQDVELKGSLVRGAAAGARERLHYRATLVDDGSAPLVDLSAWRADDPENSPARQTARVIFKDDSAAVDDMTTTQGVMTRIVPTQRAAIPYLNLSIAWLEQATRRLSGSHADSLTVPFFNLGGGQTLTGTVRRLPGDSAAIQLGTVEFRLQIDPQGRVLGGAVASQGLTIVREAAH